MESTPLDVPDLEVLRSRRSAKWRTHPDDVLPLFVAEMDYELAEPVRAALHDAVDRSDAGYALANPDLGRAVARFAGRRWGWAVDPGAVTPVADVGVGTVEFLRVRCRPGDAVVISPPVYRPFFDWVPEAGGRLVEVPLAEVGPGDWRLDLAGLARAFAAERPAAYVLCSPRNPVGRVHDPGELAALVEVARRYGVTVVADEIHAPLVLPGATFTPLLTVPGAAEVAVSVLSASKAWNLAGLKSAAIVTGSAGMRAVVTRMPLDLRWRAGHFGVLASVAALTDGVGWLDRLLVTLDARRTQLSELLAAHLPAVRWRPPDATYLAWLDARALGPDPAGRCLAEGRVALEPGEKFGREGAGHARLNFATSPTILTEAVSRMAATLHPPATLAPDSPPA